MCTITKLDITQFEELLKKWESISTVEELNERNRKCKLFTIKTVETFEERKAYDLMCNDYYQNNLKRIESV